jgi:hypothetical protein
MTTNDLIARLTGDLKPVSPIAALERVGIGLGAGFTAATILMFLWLGLRPDLVAATATIPFWLKLAYTSALALAGASAVKRIAYPLGHVRLNTILFIATVAVICVLAIAQLIMTSGDQHYAMIAGHTMNVCTFYIVMLSLPLLAGNLWILRGLAPMRPTLAGAIAGVAAGAMASLIYSFHCDESAMPFVAIWYTFGVLIPGFAGAFMGRLLLRW